MARPGSTKTDRSSQPLADATNHSRHPDALLKTADAADLLTLSPRTLEALRLRGGGPPFILVTDRAVRYRREDLWQWISTRRHTSTSDTSGYT